MAADLGAKRIFTKPHCPWHNGKVERLNRTLQTGAYRQVFISNAERAAALASWLEHYNTRRFAMLSEASRPSAACQQPDGQVHLVGVARSIVDSCGTPSGPVGRR